MAAAGNLSQTLCRVKQIIYVSATKPNALIIRYKNMFNKLNFVSNKFSLNHNKNNSNNMNPIITSVFIYLITLLDTRIYINLQKILTPI